MHKEKNIVSSKNHKDGKINHQSSFSFSVFDFNLFLFFIALTRQTGLIPLLQAWAYG